ncbi:MAG: response regulator transcription factor [Gulosibacter sp.]|uniref:response regulator transcription factor n=1 Tax=Gulosibacter sp. TaxID=2817531 RepID=UPI003F8F7E1E
MSARQQVLLVDDDETIRTHLGPFLERSGFEVRTAVDGQDALEKIANEQPDLVVLDVMMPRIDGRETLRRIRTQDGWLPVILLTQVGESFERAAALEEGADDYLNKPFDPQELLARIRAVLRRTIAGQAPLSAADTLRSGPLRIERTSRRIHLDGTELQATPKAFSLLEYLMSHPDEVFSRDRLLQSVWGFDAIVTTRAVDHRVAELRRILGDDAGDPEFIETVQGLGYRFRGRVERA